SEKGQPRWKPTLRRRAAGCTIQIPGIVGAASDEIVRFPRAAELGYVGLGELEPAGLLESFDDRIGSVDWPGGRSVLVGICRAAVHDLFRGRLLHESRGGFP